MKPRVNEHGHFIGWQGDRLVSLKFFSNDSEYVDLWIELSDGRGNIIEGATYLDPEETRAIARALLKCARAPMRRKRERMKWEDK